MILLIFGALIGFWFLFLLSFYDDEGFLASFFMGILGAFVGFLIFVAITILLQYIIHPKVENIEKVEYKIEKISVKIDEDEKEFSDFYINDTIKIKDLTNLKVINKNENKIIKYTTRYKKNYFILYADEIKHEILTNKLNLKL